MPSDLNKLINDLRKVSTQQAMNSSLKDEIDELIASALEEVGVRQIMDTGQARSIFIDIARDHLGVDFSYIFTSVTNIWGNLERGRDAYNFDPYNYSENYTTGKEINVEISDYGVVGQESGISGKNYPSLKRPDKANYKPNHITRVSYLVDTANLPKFEAKALALEDRLIRIIEGR
jgi:hypothetical protein